MATTGSSERIVSKTSSSLNCGSASPVTATVSNDVLFYSFSANMFVVTNIVVVIQKHLVSLHGTWYMVHGGGGGVTTNTSIPKGQFCAA